ncbi:hypothetical protein [Aeromonas hydrophila]|uniref:hypothetical protein n=1 Tax=Aeromonas hydrophila TaxID=644 RepID=UPI00207B34EB|nr:hypothetical protein [Aeromonas hydrophila]
MATYSEKVVYDWSDPNQLNDWTVVVSGGTGTATIVGGQLVLATSRASTNGINIISKAGGFNAVEIEFKMQNSPTTLQYFDTAIGSGGLCDDNGSTTSSNYWHQGLASSRFSGLQDNSPTGLLMREFASGGRVVKSITGPQGSPNLNQFHSLLFFNSGPNSLVVFDGTPAPAGSGFTVGETGQVMIHSGWYQPGNVGSDSVIKKVTLYKSYDHYGDLTLKVAPLTAIPANQETRGQFQPQDVAWRGIPPMYAGPVAGQKISALAITKGRDLCWIRDGVQNVQQGYIRSTVTINGVGVRRRVLCFTQDGDLVGETYSRAEDGIYQFDLLWLNRRYMVVAQDDPAYGPADYNAVAADYQAPAPYPADGSVVPTLLRQ